MRFVWICIGGAVGTGLRYLVSSRMATAFGAAFPFATLTVNVLGSFLIGVLMQVGVMTNLMSPTVRMALTTGVMGGFTTYSTFSFESVRLFQAGAWWLGGVNVVATTLLCLGACLLGLATVEWLAARG